MEVQRKLCLVKLHQVKLHQRQLHQAKLHPMYPRKHYPETLLAKRQKKRSTTHANAYRRARTTPQFATLRVRRRKRITMRTPQVQRLVGSTPVHRTGPQSITATPFARTAWQVGKYSLTPAHAKRPLKGLYTLPHATGVCVRRKQRKQVILAMTRGKGLASSQQKKRRLNNNSEFSC
ncbi:hypothetical protein [Microviridae sp.]|nr:hypothetical protein [Microviridae sp.]